MIKIIKKNLIKTFLWLKELFPLLIWVLLLISLIINSNFINNILNWLNDNLISIIIADIIASVSAWNAINSYIIASQFWDFNKNIIIISTFIIAWVSVWFIQIPAEIYFFGKRFTIIRNLIAFIYAIFGWYIIYFLMKL